MIHTTQTLLTETTVSANSPAFWPSLKTFKDNISNNIHNIPNNSPMLICGDWGSGKTSLLRAIQQDIKNTGNPTVWFDAWRYENEDNLLPALIRKIWTQGLKNNNIANETETDFFHTTIKAATMIGTRTIPKLLGLPFGDDVNKALDYVFKGLNLDTIKKEMAALEVAPEQCQTDILCQSFDEMINKIVKDNNEITIFIDDLDRCDPESALNLIDQIRRLINSVEDTEAPTQRKFRFIIALDKITLADAVKHKYNSLEHYDANRYLEKLFPISFNMPTITKTDIPDFVKYQLESLLDSTQQTYLGLSANDLTTQAINIFSNKHFNNPRFIKRCINLFYLAASFNNNQEPNQSQYSIFAKHTMTWIAIAQKWPILKSFILLENTSISATLKSLVETSSTNNTDNIYLEKLTLLNGFKEFTLNREFDFINSYSAYSQIEKFLNNLGL